MRTDFETLKALSSYTLNHLMERKLIDFTMDHRLDLIDALATELGVCFATDEDIKTQAIEEIEENMGDLLPDDITETEVFNHARKEIIKSFENEKIAGLYLVESLHKVAVRVKDFLMECDLVEDVFGSDEEIVSFLVAKIRGFTIKRG